MQNRCETQFKIQKHTFSKIKFYLLEKKEVNKGIEKKNKLIFQYEGFFSVRKSWKTRNWRCERRPKKKRREDKNNLNQVEYGTRKTCVRRIKNKRKEKNTKRTKWTKKEDEQMKKNAKKKRKKPEEISKNIFLPKKKREEERKKNNKVRKKGRVSKGSNRKPSLSKKTKRKISKKKKKNFSQREETFCSPNNLSK